MVRRKGRFGCSRILSGRIWLRVAGGLSTASFPPSVLDGRFGLPVGSTRTGGRSAEDSELDLHRPLLKFGLKPPHEVLADEGARWGNETEKADHVRKHPGRNEQCSRYEDNNAVDEFSSGKVARVQSFVESTPRVYPFAPGKIAAHNPCCENETHGRPKADQLVHLDQEAQLDGRRKKKKEEKTSEHRRAGDVGDRG